MQLTNPSLNKNYLFLIYGLLLGNSIIYLATPEGLYPCVSTKRASQFAAKTSHNNNEIKLILEIEGKHMSYMRHIHKRISSLGYCEDKIPDIKTKIVGQGKLTKVMRLHTYNNKNYLELYNK